MSCNYDKYIDILLEGKLTYEKEEELIEHSKHCSECANRLEGVQKADVLIKGQLEQYPFASRKADIMNEIKNSRSNKKALYSAFKLRKYAYGMAAALILVFSVVVFRSVLHSPLDNTNSVDVNKKTNTTYPFIANERDPHITRDLVGDPMEAYFVSENYKTKADPNSDNPIYSKDSFIKGTYPLEGEKLDQKTARVIIIQFKEDIDFNCILNKNNPAIRIIYGSKGKDVTNQFNFTYDSVTQKLLITNMSAGNGFGSGLIVEINGDNLSTAEIQDTDVIINGKSEHIAGQRSRKLSGKYSFIYDLNF